MASVTYENDSVYFFTECDGRRERCRVSGIALLDTEQIVEGELSADDFVHLFERHRDEIERIAKDKIRRGDRSFGGIFVMTCDLNGEAQSADFAESGAIKRMPVREWASEASSPPSPRGRPARSRSALGYGRTRWRKLISALKSMLVTQDETVAEARQPSIAPRKKIR